MGMSESRVEASAGSQLCLNTARGTGDCSRPQRGSQVSSSFPPPRGVSQTPLLSSGQTNWCLNTHRFLLLSCEGSQLVSTVKAWGQSTMYGKDLLAGISFLLPVPPKQSCQAHAPSGTGLHSCHAFLGHRLSGEGRYSHLYRPLDWVAQAALGSKRS